MENPFVNYKKIIADTNSKHYNVGDLYKDHTLEQNRAICQVDRLPFSVGCINVSGELNIGMMIRSACLLGAENFYIFGRKKFDARSTVGAENYINIVQYSYDDPMTADEHILAELRELNKTHSVILCEHGGYMLGENDFGWAYEERPSPLFIFGSESHGIPKLITDQVASDGYPEYEFERISIPQRGVLRSFNVSAAMNIICWDYIKEMGL
jgi:tRNA G18 (ribose-2'-O)-methylase SpoU